MPRNEGIEPPIDRVDIKYRNGAIERDIVARERRWSIDDPDYPLRYAFDIAWWQPVGNAG